MTHVIGEDLVS